MVGEHRCYGDGSEIDGCERTSYAAWWQCGVSGTGKNEKLSFPVRTTSFLRVST